MKRTPTDKRKELYIPKSGFVSPAQRHPKGLLFQLVKAKTPGGISKNLLRKAFIACAIVNLVCCCIESATGVGVFQTEDFLIVKVFYENLKT